MVSNLHICHSTFGHSINPDSAACALHCAAAYALSILGAAASMKFFEAGLRMTVRHIGPATIGLCFLFQLYQGGPA